MAGTNCSAMRALWSSDFSTNVSISRSATYDNRILCLQHAVTFDHDLAGACVQQFKWAAGRWIHISDRATQGCNGLGIRQPEIFVRMHERGYHSTRAWPAAPCRSKGFTFLTLRISFTALVLAAWGPPVAMVFDINSLYILRTQQPCRVHEGVAAQEVCQMQICMHQCRSTLQPWLFMSLNCRMERVVGTAAQNSCSLMSSVAVHHHPSSNNASSFKMRPQ